MRKARERGEKRRKTAMGNKSSGKSLLAAIPVGTKVRIVNCLEAENPKYQHDWSTASEPWKASGSWLVSLDGFCGGFSLDKLELAEKE
jgi:hypothetical protein